MKTEDKDAMRELFAQLPDMQLPHDFNVRMMEKIRLEAARQVKMVRLKSVAGYVLCGAVMAAACVFAFYYADISLKLPEWKSLHFNFWKPDFEALKSPSFLFGFYIGGLAFLLLVVDSLYRKHYWKKHITKLS